MNNLTEEYFFNYKAEFNYIKNHYEQYRTVPDALTFASAFPDFEITEVNEPDTYLLEKLFEDYNTSYLATKFNGIKSFLENGKTAEAMDYFTKAVEGLRQGGAVTCTNLIKDTSRFDRYLEKMSKGNGYISTGLKELDLAIGGIDKENENMVIAARTGIGKSWLLILIAVAAITQGLNVGFYSGEMSKDKVGYRMDTLLGKIKNSAITRGEQNDYVKRAYQTYINGLSRNESLGEFNVFTPNDIAGPATVPALRALVEKYHFDILLIDQYSLLEDTSKSVVQHERVANISKAIKNLQVMKQIPIISVAQMNRTKNEDDRGNKVQDATQIGLSDRIGQDATTILMLDRSVDKVDNSQRLTINVVKARDGGDGTKLTYRADFNAGEFTFIPENTSKEKAKEIEDEYEPF